jgi:hypothetical protein
MVEAREFVRVEPNPDRLRLGDTYFSPDAVDTVLYEVTTGRIPVRGAGYRGAFGGRDWDGLWTDMSEIVRPTRDGIHGREFISTTVDLGEKPAFLTFDREGKPTGPAPKVLTLPIPILFDVAPLAVESASLYSALTNAAAILQTLTFIPIRWLIESDLDLEQVVPVVSPSELDLLEQLDAPLKMIELDGWDEGAFRHVRRRYPESVICLRVPYQFDLTACIQAGGRVFHLIADYHGRAGNAFVRDAIRSVHDDLVSVGLREQVTLIGSGGIIAAEHVPKAIICGLDAVALDTPLLIGLQARFIGECMDRDSADIQMPEFEENWASQRVINLIGSWRNQLLEVLGAMGLREVRRLRGELGRALFQAELERKIFAEIPGYERGDG